MSAWEIVAEQQRTGEVNVMQGGLLFHPANRLPVCRFGQPIIPIMVFVARVEEFRHDDQLRACPGSLRDQAGRAGQAFGHRRGRGIHLNCPDFDLA